jgi:hypothetical protein
MAQKKNYQSPNVDVVEMKMNQNLLTASQDDGARAFEFTDPEED